MSGKFSITQSGRLCPANSKASQGGIYSRLKVWPCHIPAGLGVCGLPNSPRLIWHLAVPASPIPAWHRGDGDPEEVL